MGTESGAATISAPAVDSQQQNVPSDVHKPRMEGNALNEVGQDEQERGVGITTLVSPDAPGLSCVFKQRYTDFQVNEILPNGEVVHLREIVTPQTNKKKDQHKPEGAPKDDNTSKVSHGDGDDDETAQIKSTEGVRKREAEEDVKLENNTSKRIKVAGGADTKTDDASTQESAAAAEAAIASFDPANMQVLKDIFGQDTARQILELYAAVLKHPHRKARDHATVKSAVIESKAIRTQAHVSIRKFFSSRLETLTLQEEPGRMSIRAAPPQSADNQNGRSSNRTPAGAGRQARSRFDWSELGGEYLHFTLYKENKDTMEVLYFIASELKIKVANLEFAGTKDRRGVTVQKVAAYRVVKERIIGLTRNARGWKADGFEYKKHGLQLGDLKGNEFVLTLRNAHIDGLTGRPSDILEQARDAVTSAANALAEHGFINFYGLQRFGSLRTGTHNTGMKMIQGDLEAAVNGILAYDEALLPENVERSSENRISEDDSRRAQAIHLWRTKRDTSKLREMMPRRYQAESNLIQYLCRKPGGRLAHERDWQGALMTIQRGLRLMYVHAYQSFVWNTVAAERWRLHGSSVVEGDLVVVGEKDGPSEPAKDQVDQDGEVVVHAAESAVVEGSSFEEGFTRARPLTKDEAASGKYDIYDIVLPLPGWDVVYPSNEIGTFYENFMASDKGGGIDPHNMRRAWKDISLSGGYRKMMARPLDGKIGVEVHTYRGDEQLAPTDYDRLLQTAAGQNEEKAAIEETTDKEKDEERLAIVLRLQLGSSQYATMALRELTKGGARAFRPDFGAGR